MRPYHNILQPRTQAVCYLWNQNIKALAKYAMLPPANQSVSIATMSFAENALSAMEGTTALVLCVQQSYVLTSRPPMYCPQNSVLHRCIAVVQSTTSASHIHQALICQVQALLVQDHCWAKLQLMSPSTPLLSLPTFATAACTQ